MSRFLTESQEQAINRVAEAFGWDRMPIDGLRLLMWSAFHYYVMRLR